MLVVFSLLLFFPHNSALENWQIYLCNRFSPPKGDKTCIIDRHPLWLEGLEPTIEEWSKAAQEHVRIMTSVGENDVVSRAAGANGDEPVFVGCRKPHRPGDINSHYINSGSWRPIFKYIKGFADNTVVLKNLFKINRVAPAENGDQISIIDLPFSFQCIKDDALKPTARTPHYFYPISMLQTARKSVIGDTLEVSDLKKSLPIKSEEHNLKVDIGWGDWSCCSTCCCPNEFCSIGFGFSKHKCDAIESRQTRVGYVSFMKINTSEPIDIAKNFTDHNPELSPREIKEAIQEFEEMLMDTVVPSVPIFSHVFFGSAKLRKLEKTLQRVTTFSASRQLGSTTTRVNHTSGQRHFGSTMPFNIFASGLGKKNFLVNLRNF
uniref:Uncharacterized protein n=1 Tax=Bursaphelenchus xylophilus TaxID=6326 RepID=A0A1I7RHM1_BURXY